MRDKKDAIKQLMQMIEDFKIFVAESAHDGDLLENPTSNETLACLEDAFKLFVKHYYD